mmetsp:Transcript_33362/g.51153  ORF Transcript_33362/g.51153 Transcript_33362/m.51153 type:complete len:334 (-) Transcript_33362:736-1737(-)
MTKSFDKLNFFYATTGSTAKLAKMNQLAQAVNDPMLRFNSATLLGDVSEKVKVLASNGQVPLAYMTAKSHGLEEFAKTLENTLIESEEYDHERIFKEAERFTSAGKALLPCRPVLKNNDSFTQANWPMVNMRAKEAERAIKMFMKKKEEMEKDDDMFFDAKEYHSSNQQVANILSSKASEEDTATANKEEVKAEVQEATLEAMDDDIWKDQIDIDIDQDLGGLDEGPKEEEKTDLADDGIFVPPSHGADPIAQALKKNPQSVGLHVAGGEFTKALELLRKQLGVQDFQLFKNSFVDIFTMNKTKMHTMPHAPPLDYTNRFIDKPVVTITKTTL